MSCRSLAQPVNPFSSVQFHNLTMGSKFLSVHPLILAKCSQDRQTKIDKNYFLRFEGSWMLIIDVCSFKMVCKSHRL